MNPCQFTKFYEGMTDLVYTKRSARNSLNIHYKSYLGLCGLMRECLSVINSDPWAMFSLHILWRQNNENATNKPLQIYYNLLGRDLTGRGTIALDPTFGSFTLLEPVSH